jgi:hypothetical protein
VAINRFRADGWSAETAVDLELRQALLEAAAEQAIEDANKPPPEPPVFPPPPPPGALPADGEELPGTEQRPAGVPPVPPKEPV